MGHMIDAIRDDGQPKEEIWPYLTVVPSSASWAPPADCGEIFRHAFVEKPADITNVIAALDAGQPAIIGARITLQFYSPPADFIIRTAANDPIVSKPRPSRGRPWNEWRRCPGFGPEQLGGNLGKSRLRMVDQRLPSFPDFADCCSFDVKRGRNDSSD